MVLSIIAGVFLFITILLFMSFFLIVMLFQGANPSNGTIKEGQEIIKSYQNQCNKVSSEYGVKVDTSMVIAVDTIIYEKDRLDNVTAQEQYDHCKLAISPINSLIVEDNNLDEKLDEREDKNQDDILNGTLNNKYLTNYAVPSSEYDYLRRRMSKNEWENFYQDANSTYLDNLELLYNLEDLYDSQLDLVPQSSGMLITPIEDPNVITQLYGNINEGLYGSEPHSGNDYSFTGTTPTPNVGGDIYASASGTVIFTESSCPNIGMEGNPDLNTACANQVMLEHNISGTTYVTQYAHLASVGVKMGDIVEQGDVIAVEGTSGYSTARHLHFETWDCNSQTDLDFNEVYGSCTRVDPNLLIGVGGELNPVEDEEKLKILKEAGLKEADYEYADFIIEHESSWNHLATNPDSGAYGLCQALPPQKMASAGNDYLTNPVTQLKWCDSYATDRYGGWKPAYEFWVANSWW